MSLSYLRSNDGAEGRRSQANIMGQLSLSGLREKLGSVTLLAASTDTEIEKRISESAISYITESNEDTFRPDTVFDSVHHQAKALISERPYWWGS